MSLNPRSIATLGIGYGALAIATMGMLGADGGGAVPPAPTFTPSGSYLYGGQQSLRRDRRVRDEDLIWLGGKW